MNKTEVAKRIVLGTLLPFVSLVEARKHPDAISKGELALLGLAEGIRSLAFISTLLLITEVPPLVLGIITLGYLTTGLYFNVSVLLSIEAAKEKTS